MSEGKVIWYCGRYHKVARDSNPCSSGGYYCKVWFSAFDPTKHRADKYGCGWYELRKVTK